MNRTILHVDMNSFYASVECLENPSIRKYPVAVGGSVEQRHGIILAKNEIAKRYGVKTAEPLWQAKRKCPRLIILPPRFERYIEYSRRGRELLSRYSDRVEPFGLDESWIDISPYTKNEEDGRAIAEDIRQRFKSEIGLTVSIGVSFNKVFAKLGSDMKKPDATTVITKDGFTDIVWKLPVEALLFVGVSTKKKLNTRGIRTIGQLAAADEKLLRSWLGVNGAVLKKYANGLDDSPVIPLGEEAVIKSIGNSVTPPRDIVNEADATAILQAMSESVASRLRRNGLLGTTVVLHVRDSGLFSFERQMQLKRPTRLAIELRQGAVELLRANWRWNMGIRSLGVRATGLISENAPVQLSMFGDEPLRMQREQAEHAVDSIRSKHGKNLIMLGAAAYVSELGSMPDFEEIPFYNCSKFVK